MPRPLTLSLDGQEFAVTIHKVDREKLYGSVEIEAFDEKGNPAELLMLAADGKTLIDKGGTALSMLDEKGNSIERSALQPVEPGDGKLPDVESSFSHTNVLERADEDDYLSQFVSSVYALDPYSDDGEEADLGFLLDHLEAGMIYRFPFSYRGGVDHDNAFVIGNGSDAFIVVGEQADLQFMKLNQAARLTATEDEEISGDEIEFGLF